MKTRAPLLLALVCSLALSCSLFRPDADAGAAVPLPAVVTGDATTGPGAAEYVEARFHRYHVSLSDTEIREVARVLVEQSAELGLDWELVLAVIHTESGFHNFAVSSVGALGLMQIMPQTGALLASQHALPWDGPATLFEPTVNVKMGTRYLAFLYGRYRDWDQALAAYNWGPGNIDRRLRNGHAIPVVYPGKVLAQLQSPRFP